MADPVPCPRLHDEQLVPLRAPGDARGKRVNYMRGAVVATVDAFSGRYALPIGHRPPILRPGAGSSRPCSPPRARMPAADTRPPALPARAVRRPVPDLGDLPHGQRRRLLHEGGRLAASGRDLGTGAEGRLDPLSLQAPEPADAALLPARPPVPATAATVHAHDRLHATQPGEPERLPDRHDGPRDARASPS